MPKLVEVMDHVHLIVVTVTVGYIDPSPFWARDLRVQRGLETRNARKSFWGNPNFDQEPPFELAET